MLSSAMLDSDANPVAQPGKTLEWSKGAFSTKGDGKKLLAGRCDTGHEATLSFGSCL